MQPYLLCILHQNRKRGQGYRIFVELLSKRSICDKVPAIVGIVVTENDGWYYDTTGHFITIQGVMSDKSKYKIADPWGGYANNSQCVQYEKNSDELWDAYHWAHGYIA